MLSFAILARPPWHPLRPAPWHSPVPCSRLCPEAKARPSRRPHRPRPRASRRAPGLRQREFAVRFPRHDGWRTHRELFTGYRVQHNMAGGPAQRAACGTTRRRGYRWRSGPRDVDDLGSCPRGRRSGGEGRRHVRPAPAQAAASSKAITRRFATEMHDDQMGPDPTKSPAPGWRGRTRPRWLDCRHDLDAPRLSGLWRRDGKAGGSRGLTGVRADATGRGRCLTAWRMRAGAPAAHPRRSGCGPGFGNVGEATTRLLHAAGATIVAVTDVGGGVRRAEGLNPAALRRRLAETERCRRARDRADHERGALFRAGRGHPVLAALGWARSRRRTPPSAWAPIIAEALMVLSRREVAPDPGVVANGGVSHDPRHPLQCRWRDRQLLRMGPEPRGALLDRRRDQRPIAEGHPSALRMRSGIALRLTGSTSRFPPPTRSLVERRPKRLGSVVLHFDPGLWSAQKPRLADGLRRRQAAVGVGNPDSITPRRGSTRG